MRQSPHSATSRLGGALVLVLLVVALMVSLVLSASVTVRLRWTTAADTLRRQEARDAARSSLGTTLCQLVADTNGIDTLDEPWADEEVSGTSVLSDEESRLNLRTATPPLLTALFVQVAELPAARASTLADTFARWRDTLADPPAATEVFRFVPGMDAAIFARIAPYVTVYGQGRININTASDTVLRLVLDALEIPRDTADALLATLRRAHRSGVQCPNAAPQTLALVLVGPNRIPSPAEARAIAALAPLLDVRSTAFRGIGAGTPPGLDAPRHTIEFVYDRSTGSFLRWVENVAARSPAKD